MGDIHWSEVINLSIFGIRTYLLKEDPASIPLALKRAKRYINHKNVKFNFLNVKHLFQFKNGALRDNIHPVRNNMLPSVRGV